MKKQIKNLVAAVCVLSILLSCLVGCDNTPKIETAEQCAEEYVKALYAFDLERAFQLNASMDYDAFIELMVAYYNSYKTYEPWDVQVIEEYYKTDNLKKIIEDAAERLKEFASEEDVGEKSVFALEEDRFTGKDMYYKVVAFNEETIENLERVSSFAGEDFNLRDLLVDTDAVEKLHEVCVKTDEGVVTLWVAQIDGEWKIMDVEFDILFEVKDALDEEISYRPFAEMGWD